MPRQNVDVAVALTAWDWLDKLDGFDRARLMAFVNAWRDRGPERNED